MFFRKKKKKSEEKEEVTIVTVTTDQVRQAINQYADGLKRGISLRTIIEDDHSINFKLLKDQLGGIPDRPFYMSKETFEVFDSAHIPEQIDHVQKAVDQYMKESGEEPIIPGNPYRRISYFMLRHYLSMEPNIELYLDKNDKMVTHRRPE